MAPGAQNSDVGRKIQPPSGARDDVMRLKSFFAPAPLAAPAVTPQHIGP